MPKSVTLSPSCLQFTNWVAQTPGNNMEYLFTICTNGHKKKKNRWTSRNERKRSTSAWTSNTSNLDELITRSNPKHPKHPKHKTGTERNSSTTVTICNQHSLCRFLQWIMNFKFCDPIHFRNRHQDHSRPRSTYKASDWVHWILMDSLQISHPKNGSNLGSATSWDGRSSDLANISVVTLPST